MKICIIYVAANYEKKSQIRYKKLMKSQIKLYKLMI